MPLSGRPPMPKSSRPVNRPEPDRIRSTVATNNVSMRGTLMLSDVLVAVVVLALLWLAFWLAADTWRTLFRRNWGPVRRDDASVFQAQHSSSH